MLWIGPDQLACAGQYVTREWGDYGYHFEEIESPTRAVTLFHVVASGRLLGSLGRAVDSSGERSAPGHARV